MRITIPMTGCCSIASGIGMCMAGGTIFAVLVGLGAMYCGSIVLL